MITHLADLFPMILVSAFVALAASPLLIRLAGRWGLVDLPGSAPHKTHDWPTPLVGGPILGLAMLAAIAALRPPLDRSLLGMLLGGALTLAWGMADDARGLPPYVKIAGQLLATAVAIAFGVQVHILRLPWLDLTLTCLWFVGMTNAFNFVDSMDGLALGLAGVASAFFMLVTIDSAQPALSMLAASVFGASVGLFFYNATPARLFLGDSGAQFLGFVLAAIGIAYTPDQAGLPQGVSWFTPILVLGVPIFDMSLVVFSRLRRGRPIYQAERDHTYHRLVRFGLDPTRSVLAMHLVAIMLGLTAFIALDASVLVANLIFAAIVLGGLASLALLDRDWAVGAA